MSILLQRAHGIIGNDVDDDDDDDNDHKNNRSNSDAHGNVMFCVPVRSASASCSEQQHHQLVNTPCVHVKTAFTPGGDFYGAHDVKADREPRNIFDPAS